MNDYYLYEIWSSFLYFNHQQFHDNLNENKEKKTRTFWKKSKEKKQWMWACRCQKICMCQKHFLKKKIVYSNLLYLRKSTYANEMIEKQYRILISNIHQNEHVLCNVTKWCRRDEKGEHFRISNTKKREKK